MVVVVGEGPVAVLVGQRTQDVELLVDDLTTESQSQRFSFHALGVYFLAGLWRLTEMRKNTMQVREKPLV